MELIERTNGLQEPTLDEIEKNVMSFGDDAIKLFHDFSNSPDVHCAIVGDEEPKSIKNMASGYSQISQKGIKFGCVSPPEKISAALKDKFNLFTSYAAWEAAGPLGIVAKYAFLAAKDTIKSKSEESDKPSINELLSFYIPIINVVGVEKIKISKGGFGLTQQNAMKILAKDSESVENTYWLTTPHDNPSDIIFKLRYEEEKRLGVNITELAKFN